MAVKRRRERRVYRIYATRAELHLFTARGVKRRCSQPHRRRVPSCTSGTSAFAALSAVWHGTLSARMAAHAADCTCSCSCGGATEKRPVEGRAVAAEARAVVAEARAAGGGVEGGGASRAAAERRGRAIDGASCLGGVCLGGVCLGGAPRRCRGEECRGRSVAGGVWREGCGACGDDSSLTTCWTCARGKTGRAR